MYYTKEQISLSRGQRCQIKIKELKSKRMELVLLNHGLTFGLQKTSSTIEFTLAGDYRGVKNTT
jgi:hypothetical protein